jgi:sirohydrochlorin cobaltochelatase
VSGARLVLFVHGSRDPNWRASFERLAREMREELGEDRVRLAYMEFVSPTLKEVAEEAAREGVRSLRVLPLFIAGGGHVDRDVPEQVSRVERELPELRVELLPAAGEHPKFRAVLRELVLEAASE